MTVNEEAVRPDGAVPSGKAARQRRVGTFTLGITLVASGGAMLAAMFLPAIPPERFLQASPVILILLGVETLLAVRGGGRIKYDWVGMLLCVLLTGAALSMYTAAWYFSENGPGVSRITSRYAGDTSYRMSFESFNSLDVHCLHLEGGDVLRAAFDIDSGNVDFKVTDLEGNTLAGNAAYPGASTWDRFLEIPADGDYLIEINANYATGSFHFSTAVPESAGQP